MNRETTNAVRFVMEDVIPPALRDTRIFGFVASLVWGKHVADLATFRQRAPFLTDDEYEALYNRHPRVHSETDNSRACIAKIVSDAIGPDICDVGCGTGFLLRTIVASSKETFERVVGVDFVEASGLEKKGIEFIKAPIEKLPFDSKSFDTVVCTHVIEHILDYRSAIAELRRVCRKRLIIVVPREREGLYTFNPHFNFFPYRHSFLRAMIPVPSQFTCEIIGRDIYYQEVVS